ncbi:toll/interleukin-1 receptor domain-containing protein [Undibacterium sp.]|uniref:toll/interleukin-1 receptor domain-containing protein n=1 Tax=Undibacterium sp. TaxID=1914977 RepID=UPI00272FF68B|nr:toll/interleukin-1 receptor domain-containing protein [Undibacterium sp.]MDP1977622.1 toll/interleukin-1 receptor domain-containing protein [Undibacterium sp.]
MYNLLMTSGSGNWNKSSWIMEAPRFLEYTNDIIAATFKAMDNSNIERLKQLPSLFAYENFVQEPARVGRITGIQRRTSELQITWELDLAIPSLSPQQMKMLYRDLDIDEKWEINRTHWAIKDIDLMGVLHRAGLVSANRQVLPRPPRVFISYSWDSPEHQQWVARLGGELRMRGIDVILDQWHARPGSDLAAFMARSLGESDRVLVVCTERYVGKAMERQGGAGYEHMMVTGQLMQNAGTSKFIPLIPLGPKAPILPPELSTRLGYRFDMNNNSANQEQLDSLARELHNVPIPIPPLGRNPYL